METAEVQTKKRIKHCYLRREVYHRFIHSPEYVYNSDNNTMVGVGNYLKIGRHNGKILTQQDFEANEYYNRDYTIAIIDRDRKRIIIRTDYSKHSWDLYNAIPDDYEIFYTNKTVPSLNILNDDELLYKTYAIYLINDFVKYHLSTFYNILNNKTKVLNSSLNYIFNVNNYNNEVFSYRYINIGVISKVVSKYKLKKYSWYKESLGTYRLDYKTNIPFPSLKQILTNTAFTKKEKLLLEQKYFWTSYCYGNSIPFKDVQKYWNKELSVEEFDKYARKRYIDINLDWFKDCTTWNDYFKIAIEAANAARKQYIRLQNAKSIANRAKALQEYNRNYTAADWREGKHINYTISYEAYIPPTKRNSLGKWHTVKEHHSGILANIQLKLNNIKNAVITSNGAAVPFDEAIRMFKLFKTIRLKQPNEVAFTFGHNYKVGIYNLRFIKYTDKKTNGGIKLGYKDWLIQIGCHSLWISDVIDFIIYYHLEKEFGLEMIDGRWNVYSNN